MNYWMWNNSRTRIIYIDGLKGESIAYVDPIMLDFTCYDSILDQLISLYGLEA